MIGVVPYVGIGILAIGQHVGGAEPTETTKMIKYFFLIIEFVLCISPRIGFGNSLQERLQSIPKEDRLILEIFFATMVSHECFGYVLFGDKPIAAGGYDTSFTPQNALSEGASKQRQLQLGWQTWEKYAAWFPTKKFILRLSKNPVTPSFYWIVLINKESCLKCIKSNWDFFESVLGNIFSPQLILNDLEFKEDIFKDVLGKNECLLGILFGYGTHNSIAFHKQSNVIKMAKTIYFKGKRLTIPITKLVPFNCYSRDLLAIDLPRFAEDPNHVDSVRLRSLYESNWRHLAKIYSSKNFLEVTLKKLTQDCD